MSIAIKADNVIIQSTSFNSLLNSMRQQQPQLIIYIDAVDQLDIADGLELLLAYSFRIELLKSMSSKDLAELLGIDKYIARIIINSINPILDSDIDKN